MCIASLALNKFVGERTYFSCLSLSGFLFSKLSLRGSSQWLCLILMTCWVVSAVSAIGQNAQGISLLTPAATAFSKGAQLGAIQLQGTATYHSGSTVDEGSITLSLQPSGQATMQFFGRSSVARTESQDSIAPGMQCSWAGSDTVSHPVLPENCRKPLLWFLPVSSFGQLAQFPNVAVTNVTDGMVGSVPANHLRISWGPAGQNVLLQRSRTAELGLDAVTSLPSVLEYSLLTDKQTSLMRIDVHFADYHLVNGIKIPFSIQRYVNGALQYDIQITNPSIQ